MRLSELEIASPAGVPVIPALLLLLGETFEAGESWHAGPSPEFESRSPPPAHPRVLVAEDDPLVSSLIQRILVERGYDVLTARHGQEALRIALRESACFDLVITDVRMPVMGGWELGRMLRERWPDLPVLYISGYDVELAQGAPRTGAPEAFLRKPFDSADLVRHVARLLGEG